MSKGLFEQLISKIKRRESPFYDKIYQFLKGLRRIEMPAIMPLYRLFWYERQVRFALWHTITRVFYYTPLFKTRCSVVGKGLYLINGVPLVMGDLRIVLGENVTLFGVSTFSGAKVFEAPTLTIGNNTYMGYQLVIDVGCDVTIGNNVLIGDRVVIRSYDGHPADPSKRHLPSPPESSKPIVIEDNAWIGQGSFILKGVTIGAGSIVGAGAVITKDVPPNSLAVGNPARCIPLKIS